MAGFVSMLPRDGNCYCCLHSLHDGGALLGHGRHVFHKECLLKIIRENPGRMFECPDRMCSFIATRIEGERILNYFNKWN